MTDLRKYAPAIAAALLGFATHPLAVAAAPPDSKSPPNNFTADEQTPAAMAKPRPAFAGQTEAPARNRDR
jgi:hypothetical protein